MSRVLKAIVAGLLLTAVPCFVYGADSIPEKPFPERLVNDFAGVFTPVQRESLESILVAFDNNTSNQIAVITVTDLGGYEADEFATLLGNKWGVGSARSNGILILLKPRQRAGDGDIAIEVGYGLEGAVPDVYASRIIRNIMTPYFTEEQYYEGIEAGCRELMALAGGEISEPRDRDSSDEDTYAWALLEFYLVVFIILILYLRRKKKDGGDDSSGGGDQTRGGNIFFFPGGISFGRGNSPGGGFGGFGGFGGGSFGGGGAHGKF